MKEKAVFFPGINALRFFAAFAVIITHIELLKGSFGYTHYWNNPLIFNLGGLGVYFFFVLSGFLITYLLLKEKEKYGTVNIKAFYIRRILRIWPLYYFILILGFFVLPHFEQIHIPYLQQDFEQNFTPNLILYLLILPNVAFSIFMAVPHIGQAWSIGIEEQFYIFWPWIVARSKNILKALTTVIFVLFLLKVVVLFMGKFYAAEAWYIAVKKMVAMSKFECMAIGGIGAYFLFHQKHRILKFIYHPFSLNASILLIPLLIFITPAKVQDGIHVVYAFVFLIIIMNVALNRKIWLRLENRYLDYLGKISYGIYMYHFMIIPVVLYMYKPLRVSISEGAINLLIYTTVLLVTIIISAISYTAFELKFIKLKAKFELIKSGKMEQG